MVQSNGRVSASQNQKERESNRYVPVKSIAYLYGRPTEDGINKHIFFMVSFYLQQPTRVALNEIQKWAWYGMNKCGMKGNIDKREGT